MRILFVALLTGMAVTLAGAWSINIGIPRSLLLRIHNGDIFNLAGIYPLLNGIGLLGLIVTEVSMSGIFRKKPPKSSK